MKTKKIVSFLSFLAVLGFSAIAFAQGEGGADTAAIKTHAPDMDGVFAFAANPRFEPQFDAENSTLTLRSDMLTYQAKGAPPKFAAARAPAASYCGTHITTRSGPSPSATQPRATIWSRIAGSVA